MEIIDICKKYNNLWEIGRTYTGAELADLVKPISRESAKLLNKSPLLFTRHTFRGITLEDPLFVPFNKPTNQIIKFINKLTKKSKI